MALLRREFLCGSTCSEVMGIQWLAKPDLLPVRIPQVKLRVKNLFDKLKKIRRIILVGAPGFEPGTSCAQGRRNISWKSFLFNLSFENKRVRKIFGSGKMYGNVAPHAWSPPNFPHSETTAKLLRSVPAYLRDINSSEPPESA